MKEWNGRERNTHPWIRVADPSLIYRVYMKKQAFSSEKYLNLQRDHIIERINQFDGKLYLGFGGKMLEDFHCSCPPWIRTRQ